MSAQIQQNVMPIRLVEPANEITFVPSLKTKKMEAVKAKIENKLQKIYIDKGYDIQCDNRSYFTKSLNKALANPSVTFELCKKGFERVTKDGFHYDLKIHIEGKGKVFNIHNPNPETLCNCFATVAKMPHVKESIHINQDAYECPKCGGKGIIPCFMHVCQGVCFECCGIGYKFHSSSWTNNTTV